jgi:transposase-like protein
MPPSPRKVTKLTKQAFLDHLAEGMGVNEICRQYGYKGPSTVNRWRREDPNGFGANVDRILGSPQHQLRMAAAGAETVTPLELSDKDRFLLEFRKTRDRVLACGAIGKEPFEITAWLNPESPEYDQQFVRSLDNENLRDKWQAEDVATRKAILNQDGQMLRFVLPVLSPESYGKVHQQKHQGNTLALIFADDKMEATSSFLERFFGNTAIPADDARAVQSARPVVGRDERSGEVSGLLGPGEGRPVLPAKSSP